MTGRISYLITSSKIIRIGLDTKRKFPELYNDFSAINAPSPLAFFLFLFVTKLCCWQRKRAKGNGPAGRWA